MTIFWIVAFLLVAAWLLGLVYIFILATRPQQNKLIEHAQLDGASVSTPVATLREAEQWAIWGDSHAWSLAPLFDAQLKDQYDVSIYNGGVSGQGVETICARLGSHPAHLRFPSDTIPASGVVEVSSPDVNFYRYVEYSGMIANVPGKLRRRGENRALEFARKGKGQPISLGGPMPFVPDQGIIERSGPVLLWIGKNDIDPNGDTKSIVQKVVKYTEEAYQWISEKNECVLVLGHFVNRNASETNPARLQIHEINEVYAQRYGNRFIDVSEWLTSTRIWDDLQITPTAQDLADQAFGVPPESLTKDVAHLTGEAYAGIGEFLIIPHIENVLQWVTPVADASDRPNESIR